MSNVKPESLYLMFPTVDMSTVGGGRAFRTRWPAAPGGTVWSIVYVVCSSFFSQDPRFSRTRVARLVSRRWAMRASARTRASRVAPFAQPGVPSRQGMAHQNNGKIHTLENNGIAVSRTAFWQVFHSVHGWVSLTDSDTTQSLACAVAITTTRIPRRSSTRVQWYYLGSVISILSKYDHT